MADEVAAKLAEVEKQRERVAQVCYQIAGGWRELGYQHRDGDSGNRVSIKRIEEKYDAEMVKLAGMELELSQLRQKARQK